MAFFQVAERFSAEREARYRRGVRYALVGSVVCVTRVSAALGVNDTLWLRDEAHALVHF